MQSVSAPSAHTGSQWLSLVLGIGAVAYSYIPPQNMRNYNRTIMLVMRYGGLFLALVSALTFFV